MPAADLVLRRVRSEELTRVGEITVAAYAPFTLGPEDPYVARLADAAARDRDAEVWVAVDAGADGGADGGALLGSVTFCPRGSAWRELSREGEGEFRMLSVDPAAQGRGVGLALVELCLGLARRAGERAVAISSLSEMAGAHRLYGRLGFVRDPDRDWEPLPGVRLLCFRLDLEDRP